MYSSFVGEPPSPPAHNTNKGMETACKGMFSGTEFFKIEDENEKQGRSPGIFLMEAPAQISYNQYNH